jgi:hypothetical protein
MPKASASRTKVAIRLAVNFAATGAVLAAQVCFCTDKLSARKLRACVAVVGECAAIRLVKT